MNIFVLEKCPTKSARYQCDKHVVKMVLESAQMLCSNFEKGEAPYRRCHYNHPCTKWARESKQNYEWLLVHAKALAEEYTHRYKKTHKSERVIDWCREQYVNLGLPSKGITEFAQAMPEKYKNPCVVTAYRNYYKGEKSGFAKWTSRTTPNWFKEREREDQSLQELSDQCLQDYLTDQCGEEK